jgi:probable addiction module antidote protein
MTMALETTRWNVQDHLQTPEERALFIESVLEEAPDDPAFIIAALNEVARAHGMTKLASEAGISREGLYKALSEEGNPSFGTVVKLLSALGLRLHVEPQTA